MPLAKILIVEDENIVAMDIERRLRSLGYEVVGRASRGSEAIEKAAGTRPDLALMDIRLKGEMGGIEAADTIRKQFSIPVVFLTAYADEITLHRANRAEPYGYLLKPFDEIELRNVIEVALHKHGAVATAHAQTREALSQAEEQLTRDSKQAEEKLGESQRFLRSITEASPHFIYIFDLDLMSITYANHPILGELGYSASVRSALHGLASFREFVAPGELPHFAQLPDEWRALPDGQLREDEYHLLHADGSTHSFAGREVVFARGAGGAVRQILGTLADITQRKRAEEKARRSEELFGKAFRASPAAILFSSLSDGRLIEVNDAFVQMFGFENREQIIGRTGLELGLWANPADRDRVREAVQQSGSLRDVEAGFRRQSGELGHALASVELVELRGERCVLSLFHDITARKRAEADLQHSLSLLTATLESTDDGILALEPIAFCVDSRVRPATPTARRRP